jgi:hypothetical protein
MSFSYSGNPGTSPRDQVRFLIGDVTATPQSLQDAEVDYLLSQYPTSTEQAAAAAAEAMADRYAGLSATSKRVGDLSLSYDYAGTGTRFTAIARRLRQKHWGLGVALMADESEKSFAVGMDDIPRLGQWPGPVQ